MNIALVLHVKLLNSIISILVVVFDPIIFGHFLTMVRCFSKYGQPKWQRLNGFSFFQGPGKTKQSFSKSRAVFKTSDTDFPYIWTSWSVTNLYFILFIYFIMINQFFLLTFGLLADKTAGCVMLVNSNPAIRKMVRIFTISLDFPLIVTLLNTL